LVRSVGWRFAMSEVIVSVKPLARLPATSVMLPPGFEF